MSWRRQAGYLQGAASGLAAAAIWAGWSVLTRFAVTSELDAWDVAALRFAPAGLLLAPLAFRHGLAPTGLGWRGLVALVVGGGVPYVLLAASALQFAPAHDLAALNPGMVPLFVALVAVALGDRPRAAGWIGLGLLGVGALLLLGWHVVEAAGTRSLGHALALMAALLWAGFTLAMRRARLDPLHAAALVATWSLLLYLPAYLAFRGLRLGHLPPADLALQVGYQGILVTVVSLVLYGRAVARLGATGGAAFGALVPALAALFGIPLLDEWPSGADWIAIALISLGVYLASGGPPPGRAALRRCGRPCGRGRGRGCRRRAASSPDRASP